MTAIVTVRIPKNKYHNPDRKVIGKCPIKDTICTDVTAQHHSYLEEGENIEEVKKNAHKKFSHITRIELL